MKKLSLLLLSAIITSVLVSCGENTGGNISTSSDTSTPVSGTENETETEEYISPEELEILELNGYEVDILLRAGNIWSNHDLYTESETGDVLNDAVYQKNLFLEENYGFKIKVHYSGDDNCNELATSVTAGDNSYDLAFPKSTNAVSFAQQGYLTDLMSLNYLDLESSVWSKMFNDNLSLGGKAYIATGDITINSYESVLGLYYNYDLAEEYHLNDPYKMVSDGTWTLDRMHEMAEAVVTDLNGDGKMDISNDRYGFTSNILGLALYYGADEQITRKENDDSIVINLDSQRSVDVYEKIRSLMASGNVYYNCNTDADVPKSFLENRALFAPRVIYYLVSMRSADMNFGLLPLAKYDEEQENYVTIATAHCISPVAVPITIDNQDRIGFIIQAMADASHEIVKPAYYDISLNGKYIRDEKSSEVLDILFSNFIVDTADLYGWGGIRNAVKKAMATGADIMSLAEKYREATEKAIEKTLFIYDNIN